MSVAIRSSVAGALRSPSIAGIVLAGSSAALAGVTAILAAKWLGAADRGTYALLVTSSSMTLLVLSLGLVTTAAALIPSDEHSLDVRGYFRQADRLLAMAMAAVVPLSAAAVALFDDDPSGTSVVILSGYTAAALQAGLYRAGLHGWARHRFAYLGDVAAGCLLLGGAGALMWSDRLTVSTLLAVGTVAFLIPSIVIRGYVVSASPVSNATGPMGLRDLVRLSLPTLGLTLGTWAATRGDRLVLGFVSNNVEVGVYSAVATVAEVPWLVSATLATVLTARLAATRDARLVRRYRAFALLGTVGVWLVLAPAAIWIFTEFLGQEFAGGVPALLVLFPAAVLLASSQIDLAACLAMGDRRVGARVSTRTALLMLPTVVLLGHLFGALGAATASVITYGALAGWARRGWKAIDLNSEVR